MSAGHALLHLADQQSLSNSGDHAESFSLSVKYHEIISFGSPNARTNGTISAVLFCHPDFY
jgi:hypothetical protein